MGNRLWLRILLSGLVLAALFSLAGLASAQTMVPLPQIHLGVEASDSPQDTAVSLQILAVITILAVAPAILLLMTSFTRIVIVLSLIRNALATNQTPPSQVIIGLAMFLTFFVMAPTFTQVYEGALAPYLSGEMSQAEALEQGSRPIRQFMMKHTREKDLAVFYEISNHERPETPEQVPMQILIPAFVLSELKSAFQLGFVIFVPFIVIDMVVASTLMAMGMLMLPPVMISLPFKILLFVMVDGWNLIARSLLVSFN